MNGTGADMNKNDLEALRALQADASELKCVESSSNRFNVFEAIGFVNQELVHSRFLAFLLDPRQSHGLRDVFLAKFLDEASLPLDLRDKDLDLTLVHREWQHVDILLTNETHRIAVIIENKIWTTEHSDQLDRYYQQVKKRHPGWQVLGIYLTPYGDVPSQKAYLPFSYETVCRALDEVSEDASSVLAPDTRMAIRHYTDMVRRNIVGDSEVARLCQQIYQRHKRALDLIYKHRPDVQAGTRNLLEALVRAEPRVDLDKSEKSKIRFGIRRWDTPALLTGDAWSESERILIFELWNFPPSLEVVLFIAGGAEETRRRLFDMVGRNPDSLGVIRSWGTWSMVFRRRLLGPGMHEDATEVEREGEIRRQWATFLDEDLPRIDATLKQEPWIWEPVEADG